MRYGIQYPDGSFSGEITDQKSLANSYASQHGGVVYDSEDKADPTYLAACAAFGEEP